MSLKGIPSQATEWQNRNMEAFYQNFYSCQNFFSTFLYRVLIIEKYSWFSRFLMWILLFYRWNFWKKFKTVWGNSRVSWISKNKSKTECKMKHGSKSFWYFFKKVHERKNLTKYSLSKIQVNSETWNGAYRTRGYGSGDPYGNIEGMGRMVRRRWNWTHKTTLRIHMPIHTHMCWLYWVAGESLLSVRCLGSLGRHKSEHLLFCKKI